jgi:hypothetical protein
MLKGADFKGVVLNKKDGSIFRILNDTAADMRRYTNSISRITHASLLWSKKGPQLGVLFLSCHILATCLTLPGHEPHVWHYQAMNPCNSRGPLKAGIHEHRQQTAVHLHWCASLCHATSTWCSLPALPQMRPWTGIYKIQHSRVYYLLNGMHVCFADCF